MTRAVQMRDVFVPPPEPVREKLGLALPKGKGTTYCLGSFSAQSLPWIGPGYDPRDSITIECDMTPFQNEQQFGGLDMSNGTDQTVIAMYANGLRIEIEPHEAQRLYERLRDSRPVALGGVSATGRVMANPCGEVELQMIRPTSGFRTQERNEVIRRNRRAAEQAYGIPEEEFQL